MCSIYVFCLSSVHVTSEFKRNFLYLSCFCFNLHFEHFHTAAFFSSRKMTVEIFSHLLWYHSPETEQNAMKNLLSSFESSSKNDTQNFQYNGRRCIISFPRLTRFVCCENGVIVSFSNCANNVSSPHYTLVVSSLFRLMVVRISVAKVISKILQLHSFPCCCIAFGIMRSFASSLFLKRAIC